MVFSPIFYTVINEMTNALISFKPQKVGCYFNFFFLIYYFFSSNICLDLTYGVCGSSLSIFSFFFFFNRNLWLFSCEPCTVHGTHKHHFLATFSLKMSPTALFTHLKIILLQCFQFSAKISCIQTYP